ncbi:hypothetical protein ADL32_19185 [Streptomyces albidoflavus]|uniref:hypothetical protein n=1 Tax=Streptomyces albidoflavus TaxID=1886 RepID=UPI0007444501|nr:hypothetical protein [Streptomyces albidoflavus]KUL59693.1 hypothetical protein ADL32_19185 [Streptomyces albidoflavus]
MPTTDLYGQGIPLAALTDGPDIPKAIADLAGGVIPKLALPYASASARGAILVGDRAPRAGMITWLQDVKRLDVYDGSQWVAVSTGASLWTTISLASGFAHNGNNNGTLQYRLLNISGEDSIQFRGAVARASWPTTPEGNYVLNSTALPAAVRPQTLRTVTVPCSDASSDRIALKLDVQTNGFLNVFGTGAKVKPPWISLNGTIVSL